MISQTKLGPCRNMTLHSPLASSQQPKVQVLLQWNNSLSLEDLLCKEYKGIHTEKAHFINALDNLPILHKNIMLRGLDRIAALRWNLSTEYEEIRKTVPKSSLLVFVSTAPFDLRRHCLSYPIIRVKYNTLFSIHNNRWYNTNLSKIGNTTWRQAWAKNETTTALPFTKHFMKRKHQHCH